MGGLHEVTTQLQQAQQDDTSLSTAIASLHHILKPPPPGVRWPPTLGGASSRWCQQGVHAGMANTCPYVQQGSSLTLDNIITIS